MQHSIDENRSLQAIVELALEKYFKRGGWTDIHSQWKRQSLVRLLSARKEIPGEHRDRSRLGTSAMLGRRFLLRRTWGQFVCDRWNRTDDGHTCEVCKRETWYAGRIFA